MLSMCTSVTTCTFSCFFMLSVFKHAKGVSRVDFLPIQWFAAKEKWHFAILCPIQPPEFHGMPMHALWKGQEPKSLVISSFQVTHFGTFAKQILHSGHLLRFHPGKDWQLDRAECGATTNNTHFVIDLSNATTWFMILRIATLKRLPVYITPIGGLDDSTRPICDNL